MTDDPHHLAQQYERLLINRWVLVGAHAVLAAVVAATYLNRLYFPSLPFMGGVGGRAVFVALLPPLFPYLVSGIHSIRFVTPRRIKLTAFIALLTLSTALITGLQMGRLGSVGSASLFAVYGAQTVVYVWGANILFGDYDGF